MNKEAKRSFDLIIPSLGAGVIAFHLYVKQKKHNWQDLVIPAVVAFIILYLVTTQVTKHLKAQSERPGIIPTGTDLDSTGVVIDASSFNPVPYTERLFEDIYCKFCWRNHSLYRDLVNLSNAQLMSIYNDWTKRYYSQDSETLIQAMNKEVYGNNIFDNTGANVASIISRLKTLGAN